MNNRSLPSLPFKRVLLKLSGELFCQKEMLDHLIDQISDLKDQVTFALVVGAGNHMRGQTSPFKNREHSDAIGMMASTLNALFLKAFLEEKGLLASVLSPVRMDGVTQSPTKENIKKAEDAGHIPLFGGGTGLPYLSTDTAAVVYALRFKSCLMLKATKTDGVYTADPQKDPKASFIKHTTYQNMLDQNLTILDHTALVLARDHGLRMRIFNMGRKKGLVSTLHSVPPFTQIDNKVSVCHDQGNGNSP